MATWDNSDTSDQDTESEDERANIALMANVIEDTESSGSESDTEEVFPDFTVNFTKAELGESLSEILERYQQLRVKFKNLEKDLVSDSGETENLRLENYELKEKISKLEIDL